MRISDWSSDVCSSVLHCAVAWRRAAPRSSGGRLGITELSAKVYRPAHENRRAVAAAGHCGMRYSSPLLSLIPRSFNLRCRADRPIPRSEEHTSELLSLMRISYAVFCLNNKTTTPTNPDKYHLSPTIL